MVAGYILPQPWPRNDSCHNSVNSMYCYHYQTRNASVYSMVYLLILKCIGTGKLHWYAKPPLDKSGYQASWLSHPPCADMLSLNQVISRAAPQYLWGANSIEERFCDHHSMRFLCNKVKLFHEEGTGPIGETPRWVSLKVRIPWQAALKNTCCYPILRSPAWLS